MTHDGGPAFPMPSGPEPRVNAATHYNEGMTLRDWFAGTAPEKLSPSASPDFVAARVGIPIPTASASDYAAWGRFWNQAEAIMRYQYADAMLAARERKVTP